MEIKIQPHIHINSSYPKQTKNFSFIKKQNSSDCFVSSAQPLAFKGLLKRIFKSNKNNIADLSNYEIPTPYAAEVAEGLNKVMDCNYPASNLSSLMSSGEFMQILPSMTADSYIYSNKNLASGIYCADLDYQTSFSDGKENVIDLLDSVAQYADKYSKETGKPFIFALTDKDSIEGVQHAVRIIASQPKKFQNVKFIPGIKLSFAHEAPNSMLGYENSDMLLYGINPFSPNVIDFVESTIQKRKTMIIDFIKKVNALYPEFAYNVIEFAKQNKIKYKKGFTVSNLYWRAREYAETKGDTAIRGISMVPEDILSEAEEILSELDKVYLGSDEKTHSALGSDIIKNSDVNILTPFRAK